MKIDSKEKKEFSQPGLKKIFSGQIGQWTFWGGILVIGLLAGFIYAWRISPDANIYVAEQATGTLPTETPTLEPTPIQEVAALPVLSLSVTMTSIDTGKPGLKEALPATLTYNEADPINVQASPVIGMQEDVLAWQISLPADAKDLPWQSTEIVLQPTQDSYTVTKWAYLQQLSQAGIQVPDVSLALVSINEQTPQAAYIMQPAQSKPGFVFQVSQDFFTDTEKNEQTRRQILDQISLSATADQANVAADVLQRGLDELDFLMQAPDEIPSYLDIEHFATYFAMHDLWSATYGDAWQEMRYFYDDSTGKIEPIINDLDQIHFSANNGEITFPFSNLALFQLTDLQMAYIRELQHITNNGTYQSMRESVFPVFLQYEEQLKQAVNIPYSTTRDVLDFRSVMLQLQTTPAYPVRAYVYADAASDCVHVDLLNLMHFPIDVTAIGFLGETIPVNATWLNVPNPPALLEELSNGFRMTPYDNPDQYLPLCIPTGQLEVIRQQLEEKKTLDALVQSETDWTVTANLSGLRQNYTVAIFAQIPPQTQLTLSIPAPHSIQELTSTFPFIRSNPAGDELTFLSGTWQVNEDLVIPAGLTVNVEPGTTLQFGPQCVWLSYSAIHANGTEDAPVVFTSLEAGWPGMVLIKADESILEHTVIEKTTGISRQGWILTGGMTFYRSPVKVISSVIQDNLTEDAINIIRADFTFDHLTIRNAPSDAFDSDFASGHIVDCQFEDIGGDAVDISGATVYVNNSSMLHITDKGLSAGEHSHIIGDQLTMNGVGIGGAAKDLSTLEISNSVIQNARVAGLAAYIKKAVFGPSSVTAQDIQFVDTGTITLVQTGSSVLLNGKEQPTRDLDVKTLYALGILGN